MRGWLVLLGALGVAAWLTPSSAPKPAPSSPTDPRAADFSSDDPKTLASAAMLQMSREMRALGQMNVAKVYEEQAADPLPGTSVRALQHIADKFVTAGNAELAAKLRKVAKDIDERGAI